jgi:hypothetical protein
VSEHGNESGEFFCRFGNNIASLDVLLDGSNVFTNLKNSKENIFEKSM